MVSTPVQPNFTTQVGTLYKTSIDDGFAVASRSAWAFAPHEQTTPDMTVRLESGHIAKLGALPVEVAAQSTGTIIAPSTNPRKDIVHIDQETGTVGVATGTEAPSPVDPAVPAGKSAVARINLVVSQSSIVNPDLDDLRNPSLLGLGNAVITFTNKTFDANATGNSLSNVDVVDLANGVDGELITWDAAGVSTTVAVGAAEQVLTSNGVGAPPTFQTIGAGLKSVQVFTSGGTWTKPAGINSVVTIVVGGGGGGGGLSTTFAGGCGGGGGGGTAIEFISAASSSETITVGGGGAGGAGASSATGGAGGTSSFGAVSSATGGAGGISSGTGGLSGVGSGGDINIGGADGGSSQRASISINPAFGGSGGSTTHGGGGRGGVDEENGQPGRASGGGGGGASNNDTSPDQDGGAGAAGVVIVWEYA